jgi:hypothetical protein
MTIDELEDVLRGKFKFIFISSIYKHKDHLINKLTIPEHEISDIQIGNLGLYVSFSKHAENEIFIPFDRNTSFDQETYGTRTIINTEDYKIYIQS